MLGLRHAWPRLLPEIMSHLPKYPVVPASAGKPVCMSQGIYNTCVIMNRDVCEVY